MGNIMTFVVAIDGPAGSGKGSVTKSVGEKLGLINIDTGAMYRSVALNIIRENIKLDELEKISQLLDNIKLDFKKDEEIMRFYLNGKEVTDEIRSKEVNDIVSQVSHIPLVRTRMVDLQRKIAEGKRVIMEGRDIGTNVFPNADVKIYLDASPEERANRRYKQNLEKGINIPYEEVLQNVIFRDNSDKTSDVAPLKMAEDAILVDSTNMTIEEVIDRIIEIINNKRR